jgi:hypothetical protein
LRNNFETTDTCDKRLQDFYVHVDYEAAVFSERVVMRVVNSTTVQIEIDVEIEFDQKEGLRSEE